MAQESGGQSLSHVGYGWTSPGVIGLDFWHQLLRFSAEEIPLAGVACHNGSTAGNNLTREIRIISHRGVQTGLVIGERRASPSVLIVAIPSWFSMQKIASLVYHDDVILGEEIARW